MSNIVSSFGFIGNLRFQLYLSAKRYASKRYFDYREKRYDFHKLNVCYTFPMFQNIKIFEMPVPGYLGFLPFALECFSMYVSAAWVLGWVKRIK